MEKEDELKQLVDKQSKGFNDLKRILYILRKNQIRQSDVCLEAGIKLVKNYKSRLGAECITLSFISLSLFAIPRLYYSRRDLTCCFGCATIYCC